VLGLDVSFVQLRLPQQAREHVVECLVARVEAVSPRTSPASHDGHLDTEAQSAVHVSATGPEGPCVVQRHEGFSSGAKRNRLDVAILARAGRESRAWKDMCGIMAYIGYHP
jgi:hypothetical protein